MVPNILYSGKKETPFMTTVKIDLPEQQITALTAKAAAQGLTLEGWFQKVAEQEAPSASIAHLQKSNPREWARQFDEWVDSHDPNLPVLSDAGDEPRKRLPGPELGSHMQAVRNLENQLLRCWKRRQQPRVESEWCLLNDLDGWKERMLGVE